MGRIDTKLARDVEAFRAKPYLYTLVGDEVVPVKEHARWQDWINTNRRIIARTALADDLYVETWFTGVDHRGPGESPGPPLPFLTEVYRGGKRTEHYRLATLHRAGAAHTAVATRLAAALEQE